MAENAFLEAQLAEDEKDFDEVTVTDVACISFFIMI